MTTSHGSTTTLKPKNKISKEKQSFPPPLFDISETFFDILENTPHNKDSS